MSMKYRIRDTKTSALLDEDFYLSQTGSVFTMTCDDSFPDLKAEMEVADGVYEGDYLLIYTDRNPLIAQVVIREGLPALNGFSSHWVPIYLPINLILTNDYEVIQCR